MLTTRFYRQKTFPNAYRKQILNNKRYRKLCRDTIPYKWSANQLKVAVYIGVALRPPRRVNSKHQVVAFMLVEDHNVKTTLDGTKKAVCKKNELYLNLLCSSGQGAGTALLTAFYKKAKIMKKTGIRLYSLPQSMSFWAKHGFIECDDPIKLMDCNRKTYKHDPTGGFRMTKEI